MNDKNMPKEKLKQNGWWINHQPTREEVAEALDWLRRVHDSDPSALRLSIVSKYLDSVPRDDEPCDYCAKRIGRENG